MSFVSHNAVNTVTGLHFAIQKLISLMNLQNLDLVFTHHPALLYFLFATSVIPDKIQSEFVSIRYRSFYFFFNVSKFYFFE